MTKRMTVNIDGTWKKVKQPWVNVDGTWKKVKKGFVNVNGAWKEFYESFTSKVVITVSGREEDSERLAGFVSGEWGGLSNAGFIGEGLSNRIYAIRFTQPRQTTLRTTSELTFFGTEPAAKIKVMMVWENVPGLVVSVDSIQKRTAFGKTTYTFEDDAFKVLMSAFMSNKYPPHVTNKVQLNVFAI